MEISSLVILDLFEEISDQLATILGFPTKVSSLDMDFDFNLLEKEDFKRAHRFLISESLLLFAHFFANV